MVVDPSHERRVYEVGGDDKVLGVVDLHGYDARNSIVGEPDLGQLVRSEG